METNPKYTRPPFKEAVDTWKTILRERKLSTELLWLFEENLCLERDPASPGAFRLGFQTVLTPPPPDAERLAYEYFADFEARLVFYRMGSCRGKSLCMALCDQWFEDKREGDGFVRHNEWLMSFRPGDQKELEEIRDKERWKNRVVRDRPLHDLDFCLSLRSIHEMLAHGRMLSIYERSAIKLLHIWRFIFGQPRQV